MNVEQLTQSGRLLYGDQWQSNLARSLKIDSRRVRQWLNDERPIPDWVTAEVVTLLRNNQNAITNHLTQLESNMDIITKIKTASSIDKLCELLNQFELEFNDDGKPSDYLDYSNLPVFSDNAPNDTQDIFSYSDNAILINDGNKWTLTDR